MTDAFSYFVTSWKRLRKTLLPALYEKFRCSLLFVMATWAVFTFALSSLTVTNSAWGQETKKTPVNALPQDQLTPFSYSEVNIGGEIGRRIGITIDNNLLVLDYENQFLQPFNPESNRDCRYVGLGRTFDGITRLAFYTKNPKLLELRQHLLSNMEQFQEPDGYLGTFPDGPRRTASLWDIHETSSILKGLVCDYQLWNEEKSLAMARRLADYTIAHYEKVPTDILDDSVFPFAGLMEFELALLQLTIATGDASYREFVINKRESPRWSSPVNIGRSRGIDGQVQAFLERAISQAELYRQTGQEDWLNQSRRAFDFITKENGMTVIGGTGETEIWTNDQDGRFEHSEVCATAGSLYFMDFFLKLEGDPLYGDIMERILYNVFFASQSPDGRNIRYYCNFEGGRSYFFMDTYCCPCIFRRIMAQTPLFVFYRRDGGVFVNLYTESSLQTTLNNGIALTLEQKTDYPNSGSVLLNVSPKEATAFPLSLRIPKYASRLDVSVNGQTIQSQPAPEGLFVIQRQWNPGDKVEISIPYEWRLVQGRERQAGRVAVMKGPLVYCLNPSLVEAVNGKDATDIGYYYIDPVSVQDAGADATVRPDGTSCQLNLTPPGAAPLDFSVHFPVHLTEFADPNGQVIYFRMRDYSSSVPDELFGKSK